MHGPLPGIWFTDADTHTHADADADTHADDVASGQPETARR
ncbi:MULTISPECIES: hypothetical protein [unclassified Streptomyces]|nr:MULTISPECIES: hypothetical protein [unclassified Streptomyces]